MTAARRFRGSVVTDTARGWLVSQESYVLADGVGSNFESGSESLEPTQIADMLYWVNTDVALENADAPPLRWNELVAPCQYVFQVFLIADCRLAQIPS